MTVVQTNSIAGINSITVKSGDSLTLHKADGSVIRTLSAASGVGTFHSISVGAASTTNDAEKSINLGVGASISQHNANTLTFGTAGDPRVRIDESGNVNITGI